MKEIELKIVTNKRNGQMNIPLPKKKLSSDILKEIKENKKIKAKFFK